MLTQSLSCPLQDPKKTSSEEAAKAEKHGKSPEELQKETAAHHGNQGRPDKHTATPNDKPTGSEDAVHGDKHNKSPQELQKETASKMQ